MNPALPGMPEMRAAFELHWMTTRGGKKASRELKHSELDPSGYGFPSTQRHWWTWQLAWAGGRAEASKDAEPNMFWNDADPERGRDSIHEILDDEWGDGILKVGETRVIQRAVRLANITVRVIADPDDEDSFDYEEVEPIPPAATPTKEQP